ncbi:MAG: xanthine dehydrogenase small subunit [bacterium]
MSRTIDFVLNGERISITSCEPTRTILQYLREDRHLTGSKEGCGEGDCGACMVVVAELATDTRTLHHKAINACIAFLPTLHGKALFTVEALSHSTSDAHPVQQAMVDMDASQCGFCTPGFVMSLFAQYENGVPMNRRDVDDVLSGNLCRCTGYRPIKDAALAMFNYPEFDFPLAQSTRSQLLALNTSISAESGLHMHNAEQSFLAPRTITDLSDSLSSRPQAQLLAGGTDIGLWVTKQHKQINDIIYIGQVAALKNIELTDTELTIGAAVTWTEAMPAITELYPAFAELFLRFASVPIRNTATIGGNIANGSPIGDSMPALMVAGAQLMLRKGSSTRTVTLDEFYLDYQQTLLMQGEFLEKIIIPRPPANQRVAAYKVSKRFDQDISALCGCFSVILATDTQVVEQIRIAFGGMAAVPKRASHVETQLTAKAWTEETINRALTFFDDDFSPIDDMRASAGYRREVARNLLRRFFLTVTRPEQVKGVYDYGR